MNSQNWFNTIRLIAGLKIFPLFMLTAHLAAGATSVDGKISCLKVVQSEAAKPGFVDNQKLTDWQKRVLVFLSSQKPDYETIREDMARYENIDSTRPEILAGNNAFSQELQKIAQFLIDKRPADTDSYDDLHLVYNKLRLLNTPFLRHLIGPDSLQIQLLQVNWAYNRVLRYNDEKLPDEAKQIRKNLENLNRNPQISPIVPFEKPQAVYVKRGDIIKVEAEAILATLTVERGFCNSCLSFALRNHIGYDHKYTATKKGEVEVIRAPTGKNFVMIVDYIHEPLSQLILKALLAAEESGFKSIALPALRTGYHFGAVELSYRELAHEMVKGVSDFYRQSRGGLKEITFAVFNNEGFAKVLEETLAQAQPEKKQRERSLREDLREVRLCGRGFEMFPSRVRRRVDTSRSPIYRTMLLPWDLQHLMEIHAPVEIATIQNRQLFSQKTTSVLNMPIKLPGTGFRVPIEHAQFREVLQRLIDHEVETNPDLDNFYAYLTVDQSPVKAGNTHRRGGIHIDGVQGARYPKKLVPEHTYSVGDGVPTAFYEQVFDLRSLDPARQHVHAELERQAKPESRFLTKDYVLYFWDSYSVHEATVATQDMVRTWIRVEFSKKIYDGLGDTKNPLFDYDWKPVARPIPLDLDDSPIGH